MENLKEIFLELLEIRTETGKIAEGLDKFLMQNFNKINLINKSGKAYIFSNYTKEQLKETTKPIFMICSHLDTVRWSGNIELEEQFDGFETVSIIHGRGSCDDKPTCAVLMNSIDVIANSENPILIGFTLDEEIEVQGSKEIRKFLIEENIIPHTTLLCEPTSMIPSMKSVGNLQYSDIGWNACNQEESSKVFEKLKEFAFNHLYQTPPCEAGDYLIEGSKVVICGPGKTYLCHQPNEHIYLSELEEWQGRLQYLIKNIDFLLN